ncbi:hypothetical protein [Oleiharenicola sp. Vm1]|uniref:hypothetical protein n=1 Tax=Oleiharenicola sp. Vm1 TaxID=3398393 RepID=UPI0039F584A3
MTSISLADFVAQEASRAESAGHAGVIYLSEPQVRLFYAIARKEGSVHPSDNESVAVDGFSFYLLPQRMRSGRYRMPYQRGLTTAQLKSQHDAADLKARRDAALAAAFRKYRETGDTSALEQYAKDYPEPITPAS